MEHMQCNGWPQCVVLNGSTETNHSVLLSLVFPIPSALSCSSFPSCIFCLLLCQSDWDSDSSLPSSPSLDMMESPRFTKPKEQPPPPPPPLRPKWQVQPNHPGVLLWFMFPGSETPQVKEYKVKVLCCPSPSGLSSHLRKWGTVMFVSLDMSSVWLPHPASPCLPHQSNLLTYTESGERCWSLTAW